MLKTNNQKHASAKVSSWYTTRRLFGTGRPTTILTKEAWPYRSNGPPHPARCVCPSCHQSEMINPEATEMIPVSASNNVGRCCAINFLVTASADRGGLRHKVLFGSVDKQAPPYIAMNYKTPADATFLQAQPWPNEPRGSNCSSVKRPRHIKPGNLVPPEHNRSEMGLTVGCLEKCTDHTAFVSHIRKTTNGLIPTQRSNKISNRGRVA
jgi:hypothetical protein